jgi:chromate transporter
MTTDEFGDMLALGNALPGPIATKLAGYVGYKVAGVLGATVAVLGMVLPTVIAMMLLYRFLTALKGNPYITGVVKAIRPVVIVLLAMLILELWPKSMNNVSGWVIGIVSFGLMYFLKVNQAIVVVAALAFGALFLR